MHPWNYKFWIPLGAGLFLYFVLVPTIGSLAPHLLSFSSIWFWLCMLPLLVLTIGLFGLQVVLFLVFLLRAMTEP